MEEAEKDIHTIQRISSPDLQAIGHVLTIYAQGVRSIDTTSPKRDAYLKSINALRERIAALQTRPVMGGEQDVPLTSAELDLVDCALTTFVDTIDECVPPSAERDELIQGCKSLQAYVLSGAPPQN